MLRKIAYSLGALAMLAIAVGRRVQAQLGITGSTRGPRGRRPPPDDREGFVTFVGERS